MYSSIQYPSANFWANVTSLQSKSSFLRPEPWLKIPPPWKQWAYTPAALVLVIVYSKHLMSGYPGGCKGNETIKGLYSGDHALSNTPTHFSCIRLICLPLVILWPTMCVCVCVSEFGSVYPPIILRPIISKFCCHRIPLLWKWSYEKNVSRLMLCCVKLFPYLLVVSYPTTLHCTVV